MSINSRTLAINTREDYCAIHDALNNEVIPHLSVEAIYTAPEHAWKERGSRKYKGGCPWHKSQSGTSFVVNTETMQWWCAGCQVGGGPIQYLHKLRGGAGTSPRGLGYIQIVRELFEIAGLQIPVKEVTQAVAERLRRLDDRRSALRALHEYAQQALWSPEGEAAREYLHQRGIDDESIRLFELGLYVSSQDASRAVASSGVGDQALQDACICWPKAEGYITVLWNDEHGRPLTFYGIYPERTKTPPGGKPHKLAWPNPKDGDNCLEQTKRSPLLFDRVRRAGHNEIIVVEGVIDALVLHASGDDRVVACAAAQLSRDQVRTMENCNVQKITICLDPDDAGNAGIQSCLRSLDEVGIEAFVAPRLPEGLDPDDFVIIRGIDRWREHIAQAIPGSIYHVKKLLEGITLSSTAGHRRESARAIMDYLATLDQRQRAIDVDDVLGLTAKKLGYKLGTLKRMMAAQPSQTGKKKNTDGSVPYENTSSGIIWLKDTRDGIMRVPLTNFSAEITADIIRDDGSGAPSRAFEIEASVAGRPSSKLIVTASSFSTMNWPVEILGSSAIIFPGMAIKDHARAAIQTLSPDISTKTIYEHTGWRLVDGVWCYIHAEGAIGSVGALNNIQVSLSPELAKYALPSPPQGVDRNNAVQASIDMLKVAPHHVSIPVFAALFRAVLPDCSYSVHLSGQTGTGKTEIAALAQQHFGRRMDAKSLPGSWSSTDNALEALAFAAKDALLTIDDFAPGGSSQDVNRFHRKADRILRAQGNRAGRQRMRADSSLRTTKYPRGLILSTGEDIPQGQSIRARMLIVEVGIQTVDWEILTQCQDNAAKGAYAQCMSAYVQWLASRYDDIQAKLPEKIRQLRDKATKSGQHKRTPELVADLYLGLEYFIEFAESVGVDVGLLKATVWDTLLNVASEQSAHHEAVDPVKRYLELVASALGSGACHLASINGHEPSEPQAWGWRCRTLGLNNVWEPQGVRVGWIDEDHIYLDPDASYKVAQSAAGTTDVIPVTVATLNKRLHERGLLVSTSPSRLRLRKTIEGRRRYVLHLHRDYLSANMGQVSQLRPELSSDTKNVEIDSMSRLTNDGQKQKVSQVTEPVVAAIAPEMAISSVDGSFDSLGSLSDVAHQGLSDEEKEERRAIQYVEAEQQQIHDKSKPQSNCDGASLLIERNQDTGECGISSQADLTPPATGTESGLLGVS